MSVKLLCHHYLHPLLRCQIVWWVFWAWRIWSFNNKNRNTRKMEKCTLERWRSALSPVSIIVFLLKKSLTPCNGWNLSPWYTRNYWLITQPFYPSTSFWWFPIELKGIIIFQPSVLFISVLSMITIFSQIEEKGRHRSRN